jgi:hypothetical protein
VTLVSLELFLEKMTEENNLGAEPASQYVPKPSAVAGKTLQEWWDSDSFKELQKANEEARQRAIGKYHMLSEEDKLDMVEAITYIMCKAEKDGTSHRGLQSALGIYPGGFWVDHLMDVHNALWSYYHDQKREQELKDDLDALDDFIK